MFGEPGAGTRQVVLDSSWSRVGILKKLNIHTQVYTGREERVKTVVCSKSFFLTIMSIEQTVEDVVETGYRAKSKKA